jgi:hypothetical protein
MLWPNDRFWRKANLLVSLAAESSLMVRKNPPNEFQRPASR